MKKAAGDATPPPAKEDPESLATVLIKAMNAKRIDIEGGDKSDIAFKNALDTLWEKNPYEVLEINKNEIEGKSPEDVNKIVKEKFEAAGKSASVKDTVEAAFEVLKSEENRKQCPPEFEVPSPRGPGIGGGRA